MLQSPWDKTGASPSRTWRLNLGLGWTYRIIATGQHPYRPTGNDAGADSDCDRRIENRPPRSRNGSRNGSSCSSFLLGSARIGFSPFNDTCRENCSIPYLKLRCFHVTHLRFVFGKFHDDPNLDDFPSPRRSLEGIQRGAWGPGGRTQLRFEGPRIPAHPWLKLALRLTTNHCSSVLRQFLHRQE